LSLIDLYNKISNENIEYIKTNNVEVDKYLFEGRVDSRRGISLIIPVTQIFKKYKELISKFLKVDPSQYYYPYEDLHITIFDFIQASINYKTDKGLEDQFIEIADEILNGTNMFNINMKGIVFSKAAGIIKGYDNNKIVPMRENIRRLLLKSKLPNDERYKSKTAHITFLRFMNNISEPTEFYELIKDFKEKEFGIEKVTKIELVEHDWYNKSDSKRIIKQYDLF